MEGNAKILVEAVKGKLVHGDKSALFNGISIDSRNLKSGELFICIKGERFDGHDFINEAIDKRAAGIVLADSENFSTAGLAEDAPFIVSVSDTLNALQELAAYHRRKNQVKVVGVTGTNGKSTTKEMITAIAKTRYKTLKNEGNLNNHIGLPLTLFHLEKSHEAAVLEMGMSGLGEIRRLAEIARPEIGVITNISAAHLEKLKTVKNVQSAKGELFEALDANATAIVNADDPLVYELVKKLRSKVVTFGIDNPADVRASDIQPSGDAGFKFTVNLFDKKFPLSLPFTGYCNIYNALAAVATGHSLGIQPEGMSEGFKSVEPLSQRGEITHHNSTTIFNDTYNANPSSMREALNTLVRQKSAGRKFFVIGDMLELNELSNSAHTELGKEIANTSVDYLVTVGNLAQLAGQGAIEAGMNSDRVVVKKTHREAADFLKENARSGDCLLFKGSRGAQMEKVLNGFIDKPSA